MISNYQSLSFKFGFAFHFFLHFAPFFRQSCFSFFLTSDDFFGRFSYDILSNEDVRQGLKKYSNWPTYPQVYVKGELVGGLDIIKELNESGDLLSTLKGE